MFGSVSLIVFFLLLWLRDSFLIWDVEFLVFVFFLILISILVLLIRYAILKSATLKIWFIYSLLNSLVLLNVNLINKLLAVVAFIRFRSLYKLPVVFCYYFLELSKFLSIKLNFLNLFRLKTFVFIFTQILFSFEFKLPIQTLKNNLLKNVRYEARYIRELFLVNDLSSGTYDSTKLALFSQPLLLLLLSFIINNLVFSFILGLKRTNLLKKVNALINLYHG